MVNIENIEQVSSLLKNLVAEKPPVFGKLSAQHVIEHLIVSLKISTGQHKYTLITPVEKLEGVRKFLFSDKDLPLGARVPFIGEEPPELIYPSIEDSRSALINEILFFFNYYSASEKIEETHPIFGALDKQGWLVLHNKHFKHHFKQFGLI
jgi:hypothetical protein